MATIYEYLRTQKGKAYSDKQIESHSWLKINPEVEKQPNEIAGQSRVWGDITVGDQALVIDLIIEICTRYKLTFREIAYLLLMVSNRDSTPTLQRAPRLPLALRNTPRQQ